MNDIVTGVTVCNDRFTTDEDYRSLEMIIETLLKEASLRKIDLDNDPKVSIKRIREGKLKISIKNSEATLLKFEEYHECN